MLLPKISPRGRPAGKIFTSTLSQRRRNHISHSMTQVKRVTDADRLFNALNRKTGFIDNGMKLIGREKLSAVQNKFWYMGSNSS